MCVCVKERETVRACECDVFLIERHTCDFSLLRREGDEEVNRTEKRINGITGNHWLVCGLSVQRERERNSRFHKTKSQPSSGCDTQLSEHSPPHGRGSLGYSVLRSGW